MKTFHVLLIAIIAVSAFLAGRWSSFNSTVRADSGTAPQIQVHAVQGDTSLTLYYPNLNKLFVYQNPFIGLPKWNCAYSLQLSTPGGPVERKPCGSSDQSF